MKWLCSITLVLAFSLAAGCGGEPPCFVTLGQNSTQLGLAPDTILELDLPGCEDMQPRLFHTSTASWRLALHPSDSALVVLSSGKAPICITAAAPASTLLLALLAPGASDPAVRPRTTLPEEEESGIQDGVEQATGDTAPNAGPLSLRIHYLSSSEVQDDPIPVPRTAIVPTKGGS